MPDTEVDRNRLRHEVARRNAERLEAAKAAIDYGLVPSHCEPGMRAYIEVGQPVGNFLRAVISNDLMDAAARADGTNLHRLRDYALFLHNEAPSGCYGSPDAYRSWVRQDGLEGLYSYRAGREARDEGLKVDDFTQLSTDEQFRRGWSERDLELREVA